MWHVTGALDEVDWLRNKLERLETSISAMARTAGGAPSEGGAAGNGPQSSGQAKEYRYDKSVFMLSAHAQCSCSVLKRELLESVSECQSCQYTQVPE